MIELNKQLSTCKKCGGIPFVYSHTISYNDEEYVIRCMDCGLELTYNVKKCGRAFAGAPKVTWEYCLQEYKSVVDVWNHGCNEIEGVNKNV